MSKKIWTHGFVEFRHDGFQMEKLYLHEDGGAAWINMTIAPIYVEERKRATLHARGHHRAQARSKRSSSRRRRWSPSAGWRAAWLTTSTTC